MVPTPAVAHAPMITPAAVVAWLLISTRFCVLVPRDVPPMKFTTEVLPVCVARPPAALEKVRDSVAGEVVAFVLVTVSWPVVRTSGPSTSL